MNSTERSSIIPPPGPALKRLSKEKGFARGRLRSLQLAVALSFIACTEALYPPRPPVVPGPPLADPPHTRLIMHLSISRDGLNQILDGLLPSTFSGEFDLLGKRQWRVSRKPFEVRLDNARGRLTAVAELLVEIELPVKTVAQDFRITIEAEPVISSAYRLELQTPTASVTSNGNLLALAEATLGMVSALNKIFEGLLRSVSFDLGTLLGEPYRRLTSPIRFQIGEADACADFGVRSIQAGPSVFQGGFEKDIAVTLAPSVTLPCAASPSNATQRETKEVEAKPALPPPLQNVPALPSGAFELVIPIAASYNELQRAMSAAFTDGKLYFAKDQPGLYIEKPELYASGGQVVVKVHVDGTVKKGFTHRIYGDLYLSGRPMIRDNELLFPDLEPTVETGSLLMKLGAKLNREALRREVQQALRLDISQRLAAVKDRIASELNYRTSLTPTAEGRPGLEACVAADIGRIELSDLYAHDSYLRLYVKIYGQAAMYLPCPASVPNPTAPK